MVFNDPDGLHQMMLIGAEPENFHKIHLPNHPHTKPPTQVRYLPEYPNHILTASQDHSVVSLPLVSIVH